ncbi:MAG: hypothetical protein RLZZ511_865 [Cyanobacteriota bacterium]
MRCGCQGHVGTFLPVRASFEALVDVVFGVRCVMEWRSWKRSVYVALALGACVTVLLSGADRLIAQTRAQTPASLPTPALFKKKPKPVAKPVAKPVTKPVAKPVTKPATTKPLPKRVSKPPQAIATEIAAPAPETTAKDPKTAEKPPEKPVAPIFPNLRPPEEIRGVWLTNNDVAVLHDRQKLATTMEQLAKLNFNTVYPVIWNSGYVTYPSQVAQTQGIQPFVYRGQDGQDTLADVVSQARRHNMLVMPWFEFGFMAPLTSELAMNHPDWLTQQRNGEQTSIGPAGEVAWLNPFHPEVQQFITNLVVEAVSNYDVDGIQFDDHMSLPHTFGYDPYTVALYQKEMKKAPPADPKDEAWTKWRADKITEFMVRLKQAVRAVRPTATFSVSPNYAAYAYKFQLQDWATWVKQGIADELIVQVYRSDMGSYNSKLELPEMVEAKGKIPTAVGILTGLRRRPIPMGQIQSQVFSANERGMGTVFFYLESLWDEGPENERDRVSGLQYLFPRPALRSRL